MPNMLHSIDGVEIFSTGEWNGDKYSIKDLDEMVRAFNETAKHIRPYLKLGHNDRQDLLKHDGLPAAGWVGKLYRSGEKLLADFIDIPQKIYDLIQNKAYRKVSSEVYWDVKIGDKKYKRMISAVALLGAETPGVMNLDDIVSRYGIADYKEIKSYASEEKDFTVKQYSFLITKEKKSMPEIDEKQYARMEAERDAEKKRADELANEQKKLKERADSDAAEVARLKKFEADTNARFERMEKEAAEKEVANAVDALATKGTISPAMKPYVKALLASDGNEESGKRVYSVKRKDKEEKLSKSELLTQILKLHSAVAGIVAVEKTEKGDEESRGATNTDKIDAEINQYAKENKVTYSKAYRVVMKKYASDKIAEDTASEEDESEE